MKEATEGRRACEEARPKAVAAIKEDAHVRTFSTNLHPSSFWTMRVLGIDPGLNTTGYGVLEYAAAGPHLCEAGVVRGKDRGEIAERLDRLHEGVVDVITSLEPNVMAIEELYSHYERPRTAIMMGHARGVICLAAAQHSIPVLHYSATQIKKVLTGSGRAPKSQMQLAVQRELALEDPPEPHDVADALAIALCHYYLSRQAVPEQ